MKTFLVTPNQSNSVVKVLYGETDDGQICRDVSDCMRPLSSRWTSTLDNEPEVIEHMRNAEHVMDLRVFSPRVSKFLSTRTKLSVDSKLTAKSQVR